VSDLHCAATLLLARAAGDRAVTLADSLADARLALVYCSGTDGARLTAVTVAERLGVAVRVRDGLDGPADGERAAAGWLRAELQGIVDEHRGETVLVVGDVLADAVPQLVDNPRRYRDAPAAGQVAEVAADADGWVRRR
jgi:hypothetical protein